MNVQLYIGDALAELNAASLIQFNYTREELTAPAVVKNSYSQKVSIPATPGNNKIFSHFYNGDHVTAATSFNPLKKKPFTIMSEAGEVLESGYLKLESVAFEKGAVSEYSVTLYGGLGGFFYGLTYNADGGKRTLADMTYHSGTAEPNFTKTTAFPISRTLVKGMWDALAGAARNEDKWMNFVPAYNGFPENFDCDHFYYDKDYSSTYSANGLGNIFKTFWDSEIQGSWGPLSGHSGIIINTEKDHTEWEVQDFRSYLQRPALRIKGFLESLTYADNSGGYTFSIDGSITGMPAYPKLYVTLPQIKWKGVNLANFKWGDLFDGTCSPAELLLSLAKVYGWVFHYDQVSKTITLMRRDHFYRSTPVKVDISGRIDHSKGKTVRPFDISSKIYRYALATYGADAVAYAAKYGETYGEQRVNTGYEFDSEATDVFKDSLLKAAPQVLEGSSYYNWWGGRPHYDEETGEIDFYYNAAFKFALGESVKWTLYHSVGEGDPETKEFTPLQWPYKVLSYNNTYPDYDFFSKVQLHLADNKGEDGSMVLVTFEGMKNVPVGNQEYPGRPLDPFFILTDDNADMLSLNSGVPCWYACKSDNAISLSAMPQFSRFQFDNGAMVGSLELGDPAEIYDKTTTFLTGCGLYERNFFAYVEDRLSVDTKVITCWVDLSGMQVGEGLLRNFYYFDGAYWILNKIVNYSMTTPGPTECEFIKVNDIENYTDAQY